MYHHSHLGESISKEQGIKAQGQTWTLIVEKLTNYLIILILLIIFHKSFNDTFLLI
jgi:hypothetical protein